MLKLPAYLLGFNYGQRTLQIISSSDIMEDMLLGKCQSCGLDFFGKAYLLGKQRFCSSLCFGKSISKLETMDCLFCKNRFTFLPRKDGTSRKYCSSSCQYKGKIGFKFSEETKNKISVANKKAYQDPVLRLEISRRQIGLNNSARESMLGDKNPLWKGGVTSENHKIRKSLQMKEWRRAVFKRDNFTCQICGQVGGNLNADHIKQFAHYPELRFDLSNGRTLCKPCHLKVPKINKTYA